MQTSLQHRRLRRGRGTHTRKASEQVGTWGGCRCAKPWQKGRVHDLKSRRMHHFPLTAAWTPGGQQAKFSNGVVAAVLFIPLVIT